MFLSQQVVTTPCYIMCFKLLVNEIFLFLAFFLNMSFCLQLLRCLSTIQYQYVRNYLSIVNIQYSSKTEIMKPRRLLATIYFPENILKQLFQLTNCFCDLLWSTSRYQALNVECKLVSLQSRLFLRTSQIQFDYLFFIEYAFFTYLIQPLISCFFGKCLISLTNINESSLP